MHSALHLLNNPYRTIFRLPSLTFDEQLDLAVFYARTQVHQNVEAHAAAAERYFKGRDEIREFLHMINEWGVVTYNSAGQGTLHKIEP